MPLTNTRPDAVSSTAANAESKPPDGVLVAGFLEIDQAKHLYEQRRHAEAIADARRRAVTSLQSAPSQPVARLPQGDLSAHIVVMTADESSRFLAWAEDENVGELTLEQLDAQIRRISHAYLKVPTGPLFVRTRELRDRAFSLLSGQQRPSHARELYAAAGWTLTVLAWMSVDLGRPDAAEDHARAAWLCAERAEHNGLRGWVRATHVARPCGTVGSRVRGRATRSPQLGQRTQGAYATGTRSFHPWSTRWCGTCAHPSLGDRAGTPRSTAARPHERRLHRCGRQTERAHRQTDT